MRHLPVAGAVLTALTLPVSAQQFVYRPGWIPGTPRWTEGVEAADVDRDGDLDLFFADGDGFSGPSVKRQNVLVINQLVEVGPGTFTDESVTRLGAHQSHAKGVTTGDLDGDGWVDALFANAFNTDTPFLYMNQGGGFFAMESAGRGLTEALSSAGAGLGDVDDDGDLDIVLCDSGDSFFGGSGGLPRLYLNDGTGHFTEDAASINTVNKKAHMDVQFADVDGDFDLDLFMPNRASNSGGNHYLLLNDGAGSFSDASSLIPANSSSTYEAEVGDLDGDTDLDLFFVSLSGFQEGHVENRQVPDGVLSFVAGPPQNGFVDDNEITLLDFDNDGDLDPFVGSLGSRERVYRNDGGLTFTDLAGVIQDLGDSTLDCTAADIDNDGDYDFITAQGESNPAQYVNKIYENTGSPDDLAPVLLASRVPAAPASWPVLTHARVRDQVVDDGVTYLGAWGAWVPLTGVLHDVRHQGGTFTPASLQVAIGDRVRFTNLDGTAESVTSQSAPHGFDLTLAANGGSAEYVFVEGLSYSYASTGSGATGTIDAAGAPLRADGFAMGGGMFRFCLTAPAGGNGLDVAVEMGFEDAAGNRMVTDSEVFSAPGCGQSSYCQANAGSVGVPAAMGTNGKLSVAGNEFALTAGPVPNQPGIFFYSQGQTAGGSGVVFGNGFRCVGNSSNAVFRMSPQLPVDLGGSYEFRRELDFTALGGAGQITAGSTWNFQSWFRDPAAGGAGFNLSDAVEVTFCQ